MLEVATRPVFAAEHVRQRLRLFFPPSKSLAIYVCEHSIAVTQHSPSLLSVARELF